MPRQRKRTRTSAPVTRAATIKDVARLAGVSVATVSRVLNASAPVREPTRRRIYDAARELHFTPNASARSLSTRRTAALGVVLPDLHGEFFSELLRGIDRTAQQHGRHILVSSSHHDPHGIETVLRAMHGRVDGLIVMAPDVAAPALGSALPRAFPTILVNCAAPAPSDAGDEVTTLTVDNFGGARTMVRHLAAAGHRRIAFIDGAAHNADARERRRGYTTAMHELGLDTPAHHHARGDFTEEGGWHAAQELLATHPLPTAIFAANDMMALGALRALRDHGIAVPGEIAIAGFDDIPTARYVTPPLTTVAVDVEALGARAVTLLLERMAAHHEHARRDGDGHAGTRDPRRRNREVLPTALIIRASCGAASAPPARPPGPAGKSTRGADSIHHPPAQDARPDAATDREIIL